MIKKIQLLGSAIGYIAASLSEASTFSKAIFRNLELRNGRAYTSATSDVNLNRLDKYQEGGLYASDEHRLLEGGYRAELKKTSDEAWVQEVLSRKEKWINGVLIIEALLLKPSDPICNGRTDLFFFQDEGYLMAKVSDITREYLLEILRLAKVDWAFTTAIAVNSSKKELRPEIATLKELAHDIGWLAVGAYDGEGYVMWERF